MGTNYYLKKEVCPHCGRSDPEEHAGKLSYRWQFLFQGGEGRPRSYHEGRERIREGCLVDESGEPVTLPEFDALVAQSREGQNHADLYPDDAFKDPDGWPFCLREFS